MNKLSSPLNHVDRIVKCDSVESLWVLHTSKMNEYGFDRLLYISTRFQTHDAFGDISDSLILSNRDQGYLDVFFGEKIFNFSPITLWSAIETGSVHSWRDFQERGYAGQLPSDQKKAFDLNIKWGLLSGYTVSFSGIDKRSNGSIGLGAQRGLTQDNVDAIWEDKGDEIVLLNKLTHMKLTSLSYSGQHRPLTSRQLEVLQCVTDGKTMRDIGAILDISVPTVEKHLRGAREALGVETTMQAILKASKLNQLFRLEK